jgi:hypothetical protein
MIQLIYQAREEPPFYRQLPGFLGQDLVESGHV